LVWSTTSLLGVGLTDLGHFGRYFGQNKEIVSVFNGSVVYFNARYEKTELGQKKNGFVWCFYLCVWFSTKKTNFGIPASGAG
jgi:hypothetical protein